MSNYSTVFNQLLQQIPRFKFQRIVNSLQADKYVKVLKSWNLFVALLFSQISGKNSIRDIVIGLEVNKQKLYHLGLPGVKRSTLSYSNKRTDYSVFEKLFYEILSQCKDLCPEKKFRFKNKLYSWDATLIDVCLEVFPWAKYQKSKGAIKLHYQYDNKKEIPDFLVITEGKKSELKVAKKEFKIISDSIYCFDKGYTSYRLYANIDREKAYFVTKLKKGLKYKVVGQHKKGNIKKGILRDEIVEVENKTYKKRLRLIMYYDFERDQRIDLLTNNFKLASATIQKIYKARWQIEIFFRWIKKNLKIKTFLGTSKNAVMNQVWIAMIYYLLLAYIKYKTKTNSSILHLHRRIRAALMARLTLIDLLGVSPAKIQELKIKEIQYSFW